MKALRIVLVALVSLGIAVLLVVQQRETNRLRAECADLRARLSEVASLRSTNVYLAELLKSSAEQTKAELHELLRLRNQMARLRQVEEENMRLKSQAQQGDRLMQRTQLQRDAEQLGTPAAVVEGSKPENEPPNPDMTDLGTLEVTDGTPVAFDLGGGTNCVVTATALSDGNHLMHISMGVTNADGSFAALGKSRVTTRPGMQCAISVGDRMIALRSK